MTEQRGLTLWHRDRKENSEERLSSDVTIAQRQRWRFENRYGFGGVFVLCWTEERGNKAKQEIANRARSMFRRRWHDRARVGRLMV